MHFSCRRSWYLIQSYVGFLILSSPQHPPTHALGNRRTDHNLLIPEPELKNIGAELHYTQRGGDITFHGPHQAIISLRQIVLGASLPETMWRNLSQL
ncbi:hypothetical protein V6N13_136131 [Hibiscus sabdariffa]